MSTGVSRRNLLRAGVATLVVPATLSSTLSSASSSSSSGGVASTLKPTFSSSLMSYVMTEMAKSIAKVHSKTVTREEMLEHSNKMRLLARHMESVNIDAQAKSLTSTAQGKSALIAQTKLMASGSSPEAETALTQLQGYDSTLARSTLFNPDSVSDTDISNAVDHVSANGISGFFHDYADSLKTYAGALAGAKATQKSAGYDPNGRGVVHLLDVEDVSATCKKKKAIICGAVSTGAALVTVGVISLLCEGATAGACTVFISSFAYFAYGTIYAFALFLCALIAADFELPQDSHHSLVRAFA